MKEQKYNAYLKEIGKFIPKDRIYTDELRLLAWGTDAGFYRLIPKIVIRAKDENEVSRLLALADKYTLPVTFRAAGTSLRSKHKRFYTYRSREKLGKNIPSRKISNALHSNPVLSGHVSMKY